MVGGGIDYTGVLAVADVGLAIQQAGQRRSQRDVACHSMKRGEFGEPSGILFGKRIALLVVLLTPSRVLRVAVRTRVR
jgi:hypothetical protein